MLKRFRGFAIAAILLAAALSGADAASLSPFTGPAGTNPAQNPTILGDLNATINAVNAGVTPQSMATFGNFRNFLGNGSMLVAQRGSGTQTCGTNTAPTSTAYSADRWACDVNVASGAGRSAAVTSSPTPPAGFTNSITLFRTSGALLQPVCTMNEILTADATQLAGQAVTLSFYAQALAGLAADNGNVINASIITGTGSDQGFGTLTASPAITPAWTGLATPLNAQAQTITTAWVRYSMPAVVIASTATEIGVEICFTPTATGAGTTDGFALTGVQLEQGNGASPFEFRPKLVEQALAQAYYWQITEPAASISIGPSGQGASTTTCVLSIPTPVTMRAVPTVTFIGTALSATTWTVTHVVTNTVLSTPFLAATTGGSTANMLNITATTGAAETAGQTCTLTGAGGGSIISASADF